MVGLLLPAASTPVVTSTLGVARRLTVVLAGLAMALAVAGMLPATVLAPLGLALLVGLPHGAVDHLSLMRRVQGVRGLALGTVGYAGAAVGTFLAMGALPLPMWALFLVVSVWHFGAADREYLAMIGPRPSLLFAVAAGALPVGGLMVTDPQLLAPLATAIHPVVTRLLQPDVVQVVAAGLVGVVLLAAATEVRAGRWAAVGDLAMLTGLVVLVPPLWAFGIYFGLWHSLRHVARMVCSEAPWTDVAATDGTVAAVRRFGRDAVVPTSIAAIALVALVVSLDGADPAALTAVALKVTAAVTFPHVATVAFMDRVRSRSLA